MAENASQTSNFIGQSAQEAKAMMQHAANTNEELRYKLTRYEQEAQELRRQFAHTEHQIIDEHRHQAHSFAQAEHAELLRTKLHASTEQAAAASSSHALQATRAKLEDFHAECHTLRVPTDGRTFTLCIRRRF